MRLLIFLPALMLGSCMMSQKKCLESYNHASTNPPFDAVIVPGIPHDGTSWERPMLMRVRWAEYLYKQGMTKKIIFSGAAVYSPYCEAEIMASYARSMGIPDEAILLDTNAEHSTENVYYSYRVAKENGLHKLGLATDPFQAKSMKKFIRKFDLPVTLIPTLFDTLSVLDHSEPTINPEECRKSNFVSLKDREGFFQRLGGTFGKHIHWYRSDLKKEKHIRKMHRKGRLIDG